MCFYCWLRRCCRLVGGGGDSAATPAPAAVNNTNNTTNAVTPPVTPTPVVLPPVTPTPVVTPTNKVPSALDANATLVDGTMGEISLVAVDLDGDAVSYVIVSQPVHGTLGRVGGDGKVSYTPTAGYVGADSFTYKVNDGKADSAVATVKLTVKAKTDGGTTGSTNRAPVAVAGSLTVSNSGADWVKLEATDADGDTLTFRIVTEPAHGTLRLGQGNVYIYTPNSSYEGDDSFTFVANDGKVDSAAAKVGVKVYTADSGTGGGSNTANKAPVASAAKVNTDEDVPTEITLAGKDPEGKAIAYSIVTQPANGTLSALSGNKVTYTPRAGYGGWDTFTFKVSDGSLDSTPANVSVAMLMEGRFIDSPVQGSEYVADSQQGVTGQNGIFKCVRGEYVEFWLFGNSRGSHQM
ncbi:Ig-like domain-containing protein [Thiothrix lacustris]|uniref:Ig-like domain-containing protein n=1 Tax=Thiothrix lacustris TaxID=525917 RepID=UPI0027E4A459|nr:Ig-like domain-containing protein [Thiothrix lacustris]WMP18328.1 Ig-like domain-containing protein [Thiothrix lacustris]